MKAWQNWYIKSNVYASIYSVHEGIYVDVRSYPGAEYFFFTLFFHFWLHHTVTMYSHGGCLSTCSNMIKKSWTVPNLGVIVFTDNHLLVSRDIRLWEMRFSYISRYTQYILRYTNMGKLSRGSSFQRLNHDAVTVIEHHGSDSASRTLKGSRSSANRGVLRMEFLSNLRQSVYCYLAYFGN